MLEGLLQGLVVSFAFIGFVSVIYFAFVHIFSSFNSESYLIYIPAKDNKDELENLFGLIQLKNILFGNKFFYKIYLLDDNLNIDTKKIISGLCEFTEDIICIGYNDMMSVLERRYEND